MMELIFTYNSIELDCFNDAGPRGKIREVYVFIGMDLILDLCTLLVLQ